MSATETAMSALGRNWSMVGRALEDVGDVILRSQPNNQSNSMGWLLWHMIGLLTALSIPDAKALPNCGLKTTGITNSV